MRICRSFSIVPVSHAKILRQSTFPLHFLRQLMCRPSAVHRHGFLVLGLIVLLNMAAIRSVQAQNADELLAFLRARNIITTYGWGPIKLRVDAVISQLEEYSGNHFEVYPTQQFSWGTAHSGGYILFDISSMVQNNDVLAYRLAHEWGHLVLGHQASIYMPYGNPLRLRFSNTTDEDAADYYAGKFLAKYNYNIDAIIRELSKYPGILGDSHSSGGVRAFIVNKAFQEERSSAKDSDADDENSDKKSKSNVKKQVSCAEVCDSDLTKCKEQVPSVEECVEKRINSCVKSCIYVTHNPAEICRIDPCSSVVDEEERHCEIGQRVKERRCQSAAKACQERCTRENEIAVNNSTAEEDVSAKAIKPGIAHILIENLIPDAEYSLNGQRVEAKQFSGPDGLAVNATNNYVFVVKHDPNSVILKLEFTLTAGQVQKITLPTNARPASTDSETNKPAALSTARILVKNSNEKTSISINGIRIYRDLISQPPGLAVPAGRVSLGLIQEDSGKGVERDEIVAAGQTLTIELPAAMSCRRNAKDRHQKHSSRCRVVQK